MFWFEEQILKGRRSAGNGGGEVVLMGTWRCLLWEAGPPPPSCLSPSPAACPRPRNKPAWRVHGKLDH